MLKCEEGNYGASFRDAIQCVVLNAVEQLLLPGGLFTKQGIEAPQGGVSHVMY